MQEYGLLVGLTVMVAIVSISQLGGQVQNNLCTVAYGLGFEFDPDCITDEMVSAIDYDGDIGVDANGNFRNITFAPGDIGTHKFLSDLGVDAADEKQITITPQFVSGNSTDQGIFSVCAQNPLAISCLSQTTYTATNLKKVGYSIDLPDDINTPWKTKLTIVARDVTQSSDQSWVITLSRSSASFAFSPDVAFNDVTIPDKTEGLYTAISPLSGQSDVDFKFSLTMTNKTGEAALFDTLPLYACYQMTDASEPVCAEESSITVPKNAYGVGYRTELLGDRFNAFGLELTAQISTLVSDPNHPSIEIASWHLSRSASSAEFTLNTTKTSYEIPAGLTGDQVIELDTSGIHDYTVMFKSASSTSEDIYPCYDSSNGNNWHCEPPATDILVPYAYNKFGIKANLDDFGSTSDYTGYSPSWNIDISFEDLFNTGQTISKTISLVKPAEAAELDLDYDFSDFTIPEGTTGQYNISISPSGSSNTQWDLSVVSTGSYTSKVCTTIGGGTLYTQCSAGSIKNLDPSTLQAIGFAVDLPSDVTLPVEEDVTFTVSTSTGPGLDADNIKTKSWTVHVSRPTPPTPEETMTTLIQFDTDALDKLYPQLPDDTFAIQEIPLTRFMDPSAASYLGYKIEIVSGIDPSTFGVLNQWFEAGYVNASGANVWMNGTTVGVSTSAQALTYRINTLRLPLDTDVGIRLSMRIPGLVNDYVVFSEHTLRRVSGF